MHGWRHEAFTRRRSCGMRAIRPLFSKRRRSSLRSVVFRSAARQPFAADPCRRGLASAVCGEVRCAAPQRVPTGARTEGVW